ncbi:MAG: hypothetical protein IJH37_08370 [Clostridia bacterium]|nr:hypothetical protein [Clostridia bacterium]MBQ9599104.1 hypothetical protein [Clostridia bacterium]
MKKYDAPAMICHTFEAENIITQSNVGNVKSQMAADGVKSKYIKVATWNDMQVVF